jgi:hypothetical protein
VSAAFQPSSVHSATMAVAARSPTAMPLVFAGPSAMPFNAA